MAGDAALVEYQERVGAGQLNLVEHVPGELVNGDVRETAVGVVQEPGARGLERGRGSGQLARSDQAEIPGSAAQGGGLAVGEAQHAGAGPDLSQGGQDSAEAERLVV